jgi:hypothetical protein
MNHAKTSFSTEIFASAISSVVQYLAPLRYTKGYLRSNPPLQHMLPKQMCGGRPVLKRWPTVTPQRE